MSNENARICVAFQMLCKIVLFIIIIFSLGQMQCFRTKKIPVTPLAHDVPSASKLR